jgi:hypothetical protein
MGNERRAALAAALLASSAGTAMAQGFPDFGHQGTFAVGVERVMGFSLAQVKGEGGVDGDLTYVSFLGNPSHATPYDVPKVAFDYFVADRFSLGGGLVFASISPDEGDSVTFVSINPRLGAGIPLGPSAGVWIRGGITYYSTADNDTDISGLGLNLDAMFAIGVSDTFAITIGPVADIGLSGSADLGGGSADLKFNNFGANAGVVGLF